LYESKFTIILIFKKYAHIKDIQFTKINPWQK
jgi:hypothetical protein